MPLKKEEEPARDHDELEWVRHDAGLTAEQRDSAVAEFIELVAAVDGVLQAQAKADGGFIVLRRADLVDVLLYVRVIGREHDPVDADDLETQKVPLAENTSRRDEHVVADVLGDRALQARDGSHTMDPGVRGQRHHLAPVTP